MDEVRSLRSGFIAISEARTELAQLRRAQADFGEVLAGAFRLSRVYAYTGSELIYHERERPWPQVPRPRNAHTCTNGERCAFSK